MSLYQQLGADAFVAGKPVTDAGGLSGRCADEWRAGWRNAWSVRVDRGQLMPDGRRWKHPCGCEDICTDWMLGEIAKGVSFNGCPAHPIGTYYEEHVKTVIPMVPPADISISSFLHARSLLGCRKPLMLIGPIPADVIAWVRETLPRLSIVNVVSEAETASYSWRLESEDFAVVSDVRL